MSIAVVFPGQGSQSTGMLGELARTEPVVEATFAEASEVLGYDLWSLCQQGPDEDLALTEKTQPAMLAAGVATWRALQGHAQLRPAAMAGHSLGEYSALVCSGALDFRAATELVRDRGRLMQQAVPVGAGAMAAVLGLEDSEVEAAIQSNLDRLMQGKTVLAIAHRLSTIAALDRLVVMDKGRIIEQGSHAELVAQGGLYSELWARQSGGFLDTKALDPVLVNAG